MPAPRDVVSTIAPMAKPDLASLPRWAGWSAAGRLRLHLATYKRCRDCHTDVQHIGEWYMVHDHVWAQAGGCGRGYLCIGCLETRLGRHLTAADFPDVPVNGPRWAALRGARLADRLRTPANGSRQTPVSAAS